MRETVLRRMEQELEEYREYLVSGNVTAEQIVRESYQFVVKRGLYSAFEKHNRLSAVEWSWLGKQEHLLDYLYTLWMKNEEDLTEEFAEIIHNKLNYDMEVHTNE